MTTNNKPVTRTLVDNWLLEFAARQISPDLDREYKYYLDESRMDQLSRIGGIGYFAKEYFIGSLGTAGFYNDKLQSILHLIDLIITNDVLYYNSRGEYHKKWFESGLFSSLGNILQGQKLWVGKRNRLYKMAEFVRENEAPLLVEGGALIYLYYASILGVSYWPSPRRAEFLKNKFFVFDQFESPIYYMKNSFYFGFKDKVDELLKQIIKEVYQSIKQPEPIYFGGFGKHVLVNCQTRESIIDTALQIRNTASAKSFRYWLESMNNALYTGDVRKISIEMKQVFDIFEDIRKELGQIGNTSDAIIELGISPTIQLSASKMQALFSKIKRPSLHLVFLRKSFRQSISNANLHNHIKRLFPENLVYLDNISHQYRYKDSLSDYK